MFRLLLKIFKKEEKATKSIKKEVKNDIKGSLAETRLDFRLEKLPRENYKIISNLIIPSKDKTTQIDQLVISNYGIFVIENKNFSGNIYGSEYDKTWTQVMGKSKYQFYNPVLQNYGHIKAIEEIIGQNYDIYSIVVFSNRAILRKIEIKDPRLTVINESELMNTINQYKNIVLTNSQVIDIRDKILKSMSTVSQDTEKHIKTIKDIKDGDKCPRCNGDLKRRKGQYGDFFGCTSYPKCRYTRKVEI